MKVFNDVYADGLVELVCYYAGLEKINEYLVTMASVRMVTVGLYDVLVKKKELIRIEDLEKEEKERFWAMAPKGLKKSERIEIAKASYLINKIKN